LSTDLKTDFTNGFSVFFWFPKNFFCFQNLDALCRPVAGKPFVLEDLCLGMGTFVASALTAETIFETEMCF